LSQTDLKITKGVALKSNERATNEKLKKTGCKTEEEGRAQVSLLNKTHITYKDKRKE
jgi:hypothetical protein